MFNLETDDLAMKPYFHTKVYFNEFFANAFRDNQGPKKGLTDARSAVGFCLGSGLFGSYNSD